MAKKSRNRKPSPKGPDVSRKQRARSLREQKQRRQVLIGLAIVGALLVIVFGVGLAQEFILKGAEPIAVVNQQEIRTDTYQHRVQFQRYQLQGYINQLTGQLGQLDPTDKSTDFLRQYFQQNLQQLQSRYTNIATQVLNDMIDEKLIAQRAQELGITVTDAEVDQEIQRQMAAQARSVIAPDATATATAAVAASATAALWTPTPLPTATPTLTATAVVTDTATPTVPTEAGPPPPAPTTHVYTADEFQKDYATFLSSLKNNVNLSEQEFRDMARASLLRQKVQDYLAQQVPTEAEQIHARHILVKTKEEATKVIERLKAGEDFAAVAKDVSTDTGSKDKGGDLGWFPRGQMVKQFEDAAFALKPGQISDPVQTTFGFHIIEVLEGPETRPLDAATLQSKRQAALTDWLKEARYGPNVERRWSEDKVPPDPFGTPTGG
ncbi:MAG: hypothetical protein GXP41_06780 [Chloroflexi bacterium]|nr:hypothetical protein [Chloroflexota bacterium]